MSEEIKKKIYNLVFMLKNIFLSNNNLLDEIINIASTKSPSSAFTNGLLVARRHYIENYNIGIAKLARFLAIIRRDYGSQEFSNTISEVKSILALPQSNFPTQIKADKMNIDTKLTIGIYKYGKYGWLAESRIEKINKAYSNITHENLPDYMYQLAIEIFHSLYLVNTSLDSRVYTSDILTKISKITEPLRKSDLRNITIADEFISILLSAKILSEMIKNIKERNKVENVKEALKNSKMDDTMKECLSNLVDDISKKEKDEMNDIKNIRKIIGGLSASKVGHQIDFDNKIKIFEILSKHPVITDSIINSIRTTKNESGLHGNIIDFQGYREMRSYDELKKIRLTEFIYDEYMFLSNVAKKKVYVKDYENGTFGKKKKYAILIDKSGSMNGEKIEWAKSVGITLLLNSLIDDVKVVFFDYDPHEIFDLKNNFTENIEKIASVVAEGGTDIDKALEFIDKKLPKYTTLLITDGRDTVTYKPKNELITIMLDEDNQTLKEISRKYFKIEDIKKSKFTI